MTLPSLLLQRPHPKSTNAENKSQLVRRLDMWREKKIEELLYEGRTIQSRLDNTFNIDAKR